MRRLNLLLTGLALAVACLTFAQSSEFTLTMDQVMTPQEQQDTGINTLSPSQRLALNRWLNKYTMSILRAASETSPSSNYAGVGSGHWIAEVSSNGAYITLEDGSLWEVSELDRIDTAIWIAISNITVLVSRHPVGDFKYELVNTDDGEKALARYMGKH